MNTYIRSTYTHIWLYFKLRVSFYVDLNVFSLNVLISHIVREIDNITLKIVRQFNIREPLIVFLILYKILFHLRVNIVSIYNII